MKLLRPLLICILFLYGMLSVSASEYPNETITLKYATISNNNLESFIRERVINTAQTLWPSPHGNITYDLDIQSDDSLYIFATYWDNGIVMPSVLHPENDQIKQYATKVDNRIIMIKAPSECRFIKPTSKKISIVEDKVLLAINDCTILWFIRFDGDEISEVEFDSEYSYEVIEKLPLSLYSLPNVSIKKMPYTTPDLTGILHKQYHNQ